MRYDYSLIYVSQPFPPAKTIFTGIGVLLGVSLPPGSLSCIRVTPNSQAVRDVAASHKTLLRLFERIHLFLHRLNRYAGMPLTDDLTELLAKIMAQLLSILALSTKAMTDRRLSKLGSSLCGSFLADCNTEKILKRLVGRTEVEDAVLRLDMLTKEENLMVAARNLEVTHRVDGNVEATKVLTQDILDTTKDGAQCFLSILIHLLTPIVRQNSNRPA